MVILKHCHARVTPSCASRIETNNVLAEPIYAPFNVDYVNMTHLLGPLKTLTRTSCPRAATDGYGMDCVTFVRACCAVALAKGGDKQLRGRGTVAPLVQRTPPSLVTGSDGQRRICAYVRCSHTSLMACSCRVTRASRSCCARGRMQRRASARWRAG
eukprot:359219-Chlamydomonas_euryale.AAC.8